jgi:hypothetical protein
MSGRRLREWPFVVVIVVALAGLVVVALLDRFRRGSVIFAGAFGLAAALRLVLPARSAGLLAIRGRSFDVVAYAGLGVAIALLALSIPAEVPDG